jgi:ABC-type branched-subunit amino acid transport system substrate-binding protein
MHPSMPKAVQRPSAAAIAAIAVVLLAGCTAPVPTATPTEEPSPSATIEPSGDGVLRVGTLVPATGTFQFLSAGQVTGINTAIKDINAAGGVAGVPVEVVHADSADAATTTAEASLATLLASPVDVIIGPSSSVLVERLAPEIVKAGTPLISPAATATVLSELDDDGLIFRTVPTYGAQGAALAEVISEKGPVDVALIAFDDAGSAALRGTLTAGLDAADSTLVADETFTADTKDYAPLIQAIVDAAPGAVVLASPGSVQEQAKAIIQLLHNAGYGGAKLWLTTQNAADYSQALPAGMLSGVNGIIEGYEPDDAFKARLKESDGAISIFRYAAESYDATILAALAAEVAGDDGAASIAATLQDVSRGGTKCTSFAECLDVLQTQDDIDYDGISGPQNWDGKGDISPAYYGVFTFNAENKFVFARGVTVG